jgi:hypothetical protein
MDRDGTQDWLLSEEATPPLLGELIERIQEALDVAYASEAAVDAIGDAALDAARSAVQQALRAAEQAHRSALLAEQASAAILEERSRRPVAGAASNEERSMRSFSERADRVAARLRALERFPA